MTPRLPLLVFFLVCCFAMQAQMSYTQLQERLDSLSSTTMPELNEQVEIAVSKLPLRTFLASIGNTYRINLDVSQDIQTEVALSFTNESVKNVILFLVRKYDLDVSITGSIISFNQKKISLPPPPVKSAKVAFLNDRLTIEAKQDTLDVLLKQITRECGINFIPAPGLGGQLIDAYIQDLEIEAAMAALAFANGLELSARSDSTIAIVKPSKVQAADPQSRSSGFNGKGKRKNTSSYTLNVQLTEQGSPLISISAIDQPIAQIIKDLSNETGASYILFEEPEGSISASFEAIGNEQFLDYLLKGTEFTYVKQANDVYLIGSRSAEGLRHTQTIELDYRSVENITQLIPKEIQENVQIQEFTELNSLILSGSEPNIQEVREFIKTIDLPVPVILIELIILEVNKSRDINSGPKAGVGETPENQGTFLPGFDWVVDGNSLNKFFNTIGLSNLGHFTPDFYVGLSLLEQNGYVDIQSTPKLATMNGHQASLTIGQTQFYNQPTQNIFSQQNTQTVIVNNFQQISANFTIDIKPAVSGNEHVTLDITVSQSDFAPSSLEGAPPGTNNRDFKSMIRVKNEDLIVLGGLERESVNKSGSGFPLLSRIPGLNFLFGSRNKSKTKSKLMVFIKPTIIN